MYIERVCNIIKYMKGDTLRNKYHIDTKTLISAAVIIVFLIVLVAVAVNISDGEISLSDDTDDIDFDALHKLNPDIIAWIRIDGLPIDYPVLMSGDDKEEDYYLNHKVDGSEGLPACIYVQKDNSKDFTDPVTVIYGHNMLDKSMFASLHNYEAGRGVSEAGNIIVYLPGEKLTYKVVSVKIFDDSLLLDRYDHFAEAADMEWFISDMTNIYDERDWVIDKSDRLLKNDGHYIVLSTCTERAPEERLLVVAVRND